MASTWLWRSADDTEEANCEIGRVKNPWNTKLTFPLIATACTASGFVAWGIGASAADWARAAMLLACHVPILMGAWCAAGRLLDRRPRRAWSAVSLVLTAQIYFAALIALGLILGGLGLLTIPAAMGGAGVLGLMLVIWGRDHAAAAAPSLSRRPFVAAVQIATVLWVVLVVARSLLAPEYDFDVLTYHLTFPARWVQDAAISIVPTWFGDPGQAYAPSGTEVYFTWLMLPLHGDALARCGQLPFYLLLLVAAAGLCSELRVPAVVRVMVPLVVGLVPSIFAQAATAMVDVALAVHLVCVVLFALRCRIRGRTADRVGLMVSLGLLLGTKFIALPYCAALAPLLIWAIWRQVHWRSPVAEKRILVLAAAIAVWVGGFWYARNWAVTGNPLYPLETRVGSVVLFEGAYGRPQMENSVFNTRRRAPAHALGETVWGLFHLPSAEPERDEAGAAVALGDWYKGPIGALLLAYCVGAAALWRIGRHRWAGLLFFACGPLLFAAFWYVLPFQQPRFALGALALTIIGSACAARIHARARLVLLILVCAVWTGAFAKEWRQWVSPVVNMNEAVADPRSAAMHAPRWRLLGEAWEAIDSELHGVTIAYAGNNLPYFLSGRRLENRVVYVPARQPLLGAYHDFAALPATRALGRPNTSEPAIDRYVMSPETWLENLRSLEVDYVLVTAMFPVLLPNYRHDRQGFPIERQWLDSLCAKDEGGEAFAVRRTFAGGGALLYKLNHQVSPTGVSQLPTVKRTETDALALLRTHPETHTGVLPNYPHARAFIEQAGLKPLD